MCSGSQQGEDGTVGVGGDGGRGIHLEVTPVINADIRALGEQVGEKYETTRRITLNSTVVRVHGHATRTLRSSEDMAFGFRVCSSQAASAPETRGGAVGPSFTAGRVSPCAWRHCQHSGSQVAAHAPTRSVSAPRAPGPHTRIPPPGSWHLSLHAPPFALRVAVAGRVAPSGYRWALVRLVRLVSSRASRAYAVQRRIHTPVPPLCRIALPRSLRHHPVWSVL
jgi:hypothetical protein